MQPYKFHEKIELTLLLAQEQVIASADARQLFTQKHIDYPRSTDAPLHYDETGMVRHDCPNDSRILA
jgi:hypothetical protein